jgi:hypothetical protein
VAYGVIGGVLTADDSIAELRSVVDRRHIPTMRAQMMMGYATEEKRSGPLS